MLAKNKKTSPDKMDLIKYHKPSFVNWVRYTRHAKFMLLVITVLAFGSIGYAMQNFSSAGSCSQELPRNAPPNLRKLREPTDTQITLVWDQSSNICNGTQAPSYKVSRAKSNAGSIAESTTYTTSNAHTANSLQANISYSFSVCAYNPQNGTINSIYCSIITLKTKSAGYGEDCSGDRPNAPTNLRRTAKTTTSITMAWNRSGDVCGNPANYTIIRYDSTPYTYGSHNGVNNVGTNLSFKASSLRSNKLYVFDVCAFNNSSGPNGGFDKTKNCSRISSSTLAASSPAPAPSPPPSNPTPPSPPPGSPNPSPSPGSPPPPSGGGGSPNPGSTSPSNPRIQGSDTAPVVFENDKTAPATPERFTANVAADSAVVELGWFTGEEVDLEHYQLERSTDEKDWKVLDDSVYNTFYNDTTARYETEYFYRLRAVDTSDNASDYATVSLMTPAFTANVTTLEGGAITSEDGSVTVVFPPKSFDEDAQCSLSESNDIGPVEAGFELVKGPYQITCKSVSAFILPASSEPLQASVKIDSEVSERYAELRTYAAASDDEWVVVEPTLEGDTYNFTIQDQQLLAVLGKPHGGGILAKILIGGFSLLGLGGITVGILYWRYKRQQQAVYDNFARQQAGL